MRKIFRSPEKCLEYNTLVEIQRAGSDKTIQENNYESLVLHVSKADYKPELKKKKKKKQWYYSKDKHTGYGTIQRPKKVHKYTFHI